MTCNLAVPRVLEGGVLGVGEGQSADSFHEPWGTVQLAEVWLHRIV